MSPKEKAKEIIDRFQFEPEQVMYSKTVKHCALICVDEILEVTKYDDYPRKKTHMDKEYWQQVKQEIDQL